MIYLLLRVNLNFNNLNDFLTYREKCPLCNNRLELICYPTSELYSSNILNHKCDIDNNYIYISINSLLFCTMNIRTNYVSWTFEEITHDLHFYLRCKRFHFSSEIKLIFDVDKTKINEIYLDRENCFLYIKEKYFDITDICKENISSVLIREKELEQKLNVDTLILSKFKNKKQLIKKLKLIQLLI